MNRHDAPTASQLLARSLWDEHAARCQGDHRRARAVAQASRKERIGQGTRWTQNEILTALRQFRATYHHAPTRADWRDAAVLGLPAASTVRMKFAGGLPEAWDLSRREETI